MKRVRVQHARSRVDSRGRHAVGLGLRIGYWPCLGGPFVSITFASHRVDVWFGRPSYWDS